MPQALGGWSIIKLDPEERSELLPHDEDYDLSPENSHPNARRLLTESFYWDCTDDEAPLGNDNGADLFAHWSKAEESGAFQESLTFLNAVLEQWGFSFSAWYAGSSEAERLYKLHGYAFYAANDTAIALAFGMIVIHGSARSDVIDLALAAISREFGSSILQSRWANPESRRRKLESMQGVLKSLKDDGH